MIAKVNPKYLILVHGSLDALHELARTGDLRDKHYVHIPQVGEKIEYGVVPENLRGNQQARIEAPQEFDVEVVSETEGAWIRIPESVVESDPRWQILAVNGVLKAKWYCFKAICCNWAVIDDGSSDLVRVYVWKRLLC